MSLTRLIAAAILTVGAAPLTAQVTTFDVDTVLRIEDSIRFQDYLVVDGPAGPTTLELAEGQLRASDVEIVGGSRLLVTGGELRRGTTLLRENSTLELAAGTIFPRVIATDSARVLLDGGTITYGDIRAEGNSRVEFDGTSLHGTSIELSDNSRMEVTSGSLTDLEIEATGNSFVSVQGGEGSDVFFDAGVTFRENADGTLTQYGGSLSVGRRDLGRFDLQFDGSEILVPPVDSLEEMYIRGGSATGDVSVRVTQHFSVTDVTYEGRIFLGSKSAATFVGGSVNRHRMEEPLDTRLGRGAPVAIRNQAQLEFRDATVGGVFVRDRGSVEFSGGTSLGQLAVVEAGHARLEGESYLRIDAGGAARLDLRSGAVRDGIHLSDFARLGVFGSNLAVDDGLLTGVLDDGTPLSVPIQIEGNAKVLFNESAIGPPDHVRFNPENGHFYQVVEVPQSATASIDAFAIARAQQFSGLPGHAATIVDRAESEFIESEFPSRQVEGGFYGLLTIGASDYTVEGEWLWADGPERGEVFYRRDTEDVVEYAEWGPDTREPNDWRSGEDFAVIYWEIGQWNDVSLGRSELVLVEYSVMLGDLDVDGTVDLQDFAALKENFGRTDALHADGDVNGDQSVDLRDFEYLKRNFGATGGPTLDWFDEPLPFDPPAPVPEPPTALLAGMAAAVLCGGRMRRSG